jgi:hypothetical protein
MEARFGRLGSGGRRLAVGGADYAVPELMARLGIAFEGCRSIDGLALGPDRYAVRFLDGDEQQIVAYEFDSEFRYLTETRVHVAEWIGDAALEEALSRWTWT